MRRLRRTEALFAALIVAAVAAVYANSLRGAFQFDDWNVIVDDPRVQSLSAWWTSMPGIRPLLKLSYAANHASGFGRTGFHAQNVAIHAANALLVGALVTRLLRRTSDKRASETAGVTANKIAGLGASEIAGLAAALLFGLHPVQSEAVTYISGRSASLAALFALGSMVAWVAGRDEGRRGWTLVLSPALFAAALCVKETAVVVPLALLLIDATFRVPASRQRETIGTAPARRRETFGTLAPHAVVVLLAATAALASPTYRMLIATSFETRGAGANLLAQIGAVPYLAGQLVRLDRLNIDPALPVAASLTPSLALQGALLVTLIAAALAGLRRRPGFAFGVLWFFLWLAPTNSIVPRLDVANDRQLYLAILGPIALLVGWASRQHRKRWIVIGLWMVALALGVATAARNTVYATEISLWEDVVKKSPHNARAFNNLGYAYALACRRGDAEAAWQTALRLDPALFQAGVNLRLLREDSLPGVSDICRGAPGTVAPRAPIPRPR